MPEKRVEELVRNAVAQALERQLVQVRETVIREVLREIGPSLAGGNHSGASSGALQKAVATIQTGSTQKEILRALLDNTVLYSGRAALFVVKNGSATGWQGIGFGGSDSVKDFSLNVSSGVIARALQSRSAENGGPANFDQSFLSKFGKPQGNQIAVLPLLLRDKVSALIYADAGDGSTFDVAALDVLVRATGSWLEVVSQRKQVQKDAGSEPAEVAHLPAGNDPFAAHAPLHAANAQHVPEGVAVAAMSAAASSGGVTTSAMASEDAELQGKAQRFARLLMDEIKLYNQAKVMEGRKHRDLYDRLKEDIEKSRATYQKRYGNTSAASADYFNQELIRSLAEDDVSLLGNNFRR